MLDQSDNEGAKPAHRAAAQPAELPTKADGMSAIPLVLMSGGWLGPVFMFWMYAWGPLRPFAYPAGDFAPPVLVFVLALAICFGLAWVPAAYYRIAAFERSGRIYELLGIRLFRKIVPDGDLANRWRRRTEPAQKMIHHRAHAAAFVQRTEQSEKGHLVLLALGLYSAAHAAAIGWWGWATFISVGNLLVNLYPIMLQRYTRGRITRMFRRERVRQTTA